MTPPLSGDSISVCVGWLEHTLRVMEQEMKLCLCILCANAIKLECGLQRDGNGGVWDQTDHGIFEK